MAKKRAAKEVENDRAGATKKNRTADAKKKRMISRIG
jgi:hypothetical protein